MKKEGGEPFLVTVEIKEFKDFLSSNDLIDMGFSGSEFTWCNNHNGRIRIWERINKGLCNDVWLHLFPSTSITHPERINSDHCLLHDRIEVDRGVRPFHFEEIWLEFAEF